MTIIFFEPYYIAGAVTGALGGFIIGLVTFYGKPFFIRFGLKKTPIEPVIIGTGQIEVPCKPIDNGRFEHRGRPYIAPQDRLVPKNLIAGSVSGVYIEGIPSPIAITQRTMSFKLKDNTILSEALRSILHNDALKKMFTRDITNKTLLIVIIVGIAATAMVYVKLYGDAEYMKLVGSVIDQKFVALEKLITQLPDIQEIQRSVNSTNPKGPQGITPPGGG
jgi:hypothetical protein